MIIQCPACGARAKLPDSKEGAKVRCGECGRVYVAGVGRRGGTRSSNGGLWIGLGAGGLVALLVLFALVRRGEDKDTLASESTTSQVKKETATTSPADDLWSYEGPIARAAREMHLAARALDATRLRAGIHPAGVYAWRIERTDSDAAAAEAVAAGGRTQEVEAAREAVRAAAESERRAREQAFEALPTAEREALVESYVDALVHPDTPDAPPEWDLVGAWQPYSGEVLQADPAHSVVRVQVRPGSGDSIENRTVDWTFVRRDGRWLASRWERFLTDAEKKDALRRLISTRGGLKGVEKVELSDGSVVLEREPEPLGFLEGTTPEQKAEIERLMATMTDVKLTKEATKARNALVAIGKPAIPPLLTFLYETPLDTEEQSIQVNQAVLALRDITGQYFGYEPQELVGSGTGTTRERRESAIRQWFAWWYRNEDRFTKRETTDAFEDQIELTDEDKRWLERHGDG